MATAVTFNGLDMNDGTVYITQDIDHAVAPQRNMPTFNLARANGAVITDSTYGIKTIPHSGILQDTTVAGLESKIDTFHQTMSGFKKNLDIGYAGSTRRYVATANRAVISRPVAGSPWAEFNVEYTIVEFGRDTASTTLLNTSSTLATYIPSITVGGSAPQQYLTITITVTAATGLANKTISVTTAAGLQISVKRTWTVGNVLTIDEAALINNSGQPVKVGSTPVDFTGYFPSLSSSTSSQALTFTNDFTTRTLDYNITQIKRYI